MVAMPCSAIAAMCSGRSRRARRPPWIAGCRVLTRPSSISGKPVCAATSVTSRPASARSRAVPPVESSFTPSAASSRASSTTPVLSDTEISACMAGGFLLDELVLDQLAAQSVAVDAEPLRGPALVALGVLHHGLEQRSLDHLEDHVVYRRRIDAAQVAEVRLQAVTHAFLDVFPRRHCAPVWVLLSSVDRMGRRACRGRHQRGAVGEGV